MKLRSVVHRCVEDGNGRAYAFLQPSAAIFAVDAEARQALAAFVSATDPTAYAATRPDPTAAHGAVQELLRLGALRPEGEVLPPSAELPPMPFPLATLVLNVTNKCNLSCTYCYEYGQDRLHGQGGDLLAGKPRQAMMDATTATDAVDFLLREAKSRPQVSITFFGGETLLNLPTIRAAVEYAELRGREARKRVQFALTTNATLLDDSTVDFLVAHRFGVTVSIDGGRQDHDRHRRFRSGQGSFDRVLPNLQRLIAHNRQQRGRPIGARVTLTREHAPVRDSYAYLHDELGFDQVGFAPVTSGPDRAFALEAGDYDRLLADFTALAQDFVAAALAGKAHGFANLDDMLRELHTGANKAHPCGAGLGLLGVATDGELGLCHRFVESPGHALGSLQQGLDEARRSDFLRAAHVEHKTDCRTCFARPICAGGCYHEALVRHGRATAANLHYCDWIRGFADLGLTSYAAIAAGNPDFLARYQSS